MGKSFSGFLALAYRHSSLFSEKVFIPFTMTEFDAFYQKWPIRDYFRFVKPLEDLFNQFIRLSHLNTYFMKRVTIYNDAR